MERRDNRQTFETRDARGLPLRVEFRDDGVTPTRIVGYAAVFDELSDDLGGFREKIDPGAFDETLDDDIRALWNHDPNQILGRTVSGTLKLATDSRGLQFDVDPPDADWVRSLGQSIRRGDVSGSSFSFRTLRDRWERTKDGDEIRTLESVQVFDVGPVAFPAYPQTEVAVRSRAAWLETECTDDEDPAPAPGTPELDARTERQRRAELD